jgi:hypothetical protein
MSTGFHCLLIHISIEGTLFEVVIDILFVAYRFRFVIRCVCIYEAGDLYRKEYIVAFKMTL